MIKRLTICLALLVTGMVETQAQEAFFKKLQSERVESDNTVIWTTQVSPGNAGYANFIRYHPTIPGKVALSQDMWNHYQSDNNGSRWYSTVDYDGDGRFGRMLDVEWCLNDPKTAISISTSELWVSRDTARSFQLVLNCPWYKKDKDGSDKDSWRKKVAAVAIDPNQSDTWFVAGGGHVRGMDWMSTMKSANAANPHGKETEGEGKLWKTTDAGKSWELINSGIHEKAQIGRIIVHPKNSKQVFAASTYGLYKSDNGGKSWKQIGAKSFNSNVIMDMDYYYDASSGDFILYLIDQIQYLPDSKTTKCIGGVYTSSNEGKSWKKINGNLGLDINQLSGGVPKSYYGFISRWFGIKPAEAKKLYPELPTDALQYFNSLSTDPSMKGRVYIGFDDPHQKKSIVPGRLWVTEDNGNRWTNTARLFTHVWENDKDYWESRGNPWHENMEAGHEHHPIQWGGIYPIRANRGFDVGADGSVMMLNGHNTFLSTNAGKSWKQCDEDYSASGSIIGHGNSNMCALTITQDKRDSITLLGAAEHCLWIPTDESQDDRIAIKYVNTAPETVSNIVFDPYDSQTAYLTSNRQKDKEHIFKSTDGGETWKIHGVATPASKTWLDDFYTNGLTIDPINNQYMYHGVTRIVNKKRLKEGGFFRSEDGGKTFQASNVGLPSPVRVNDVQFDPRDNSCQSLFIAAEYSNFAYHGPTAEGGLFHSSNRGESWTRVNTPDQVKGVQFVYFDHTNRMYITTGYRGGGAGVWYSDDFGKNWTKVFGYAGVDVIDVSPFDHNMIVLGNRYGKKNPGVYISRDRGETWSKCNKDIILPQVIEDVKFDILDPSKMWIATKGTGFYRGELENGGKVQVVDIRQRSIKFTNKESKQLHADFVSPQYSEKSVLWKSANDAIAKVNDKGEVIPVSKGQTKIWATTTDGRFSDYTIVTVMP
ncbi:VPS10 domain-containing protein [Reichenbachiella versicolor]|uniref:VPS10 domain-containing protein n=1 Tax=Reichenbachiella versicolor TaxID=1821036 RepID=UPI000D6E7B47|nr:Ig-like domain-containing protein [Reichenbachiella versicolor]